MKLLRPLAFALFAFVFFAAAPLAFAHRPEDGNLVGLTEIPDPNTSYAYYRQLDASSPVHVYTFEGQAGQLFHAGINIPQIPGLENYQVSMALLGPGLPDINGSDPAASSPTTGAESAVDHVQESGVSNIPIPGEISQEENGLLLVESKDGEDFFEPFTQTSYWGRQAIDLDLPEDGQYYLLVWNPGGIEGKYVLDTGTQEVFEAADLFRFPIWWLETRLYFEQGSSLLAGASIVFLGIAGVVIVRRYRN